MKLLEQILRVVMAMVIILAMIAVAVFFFEARKATAQTIVTLKQVSKDADDTKQMLNATLFQVGNVSNAAAQMILAEQKYVKQESQALIYTTAKLDQTLDQVQATVRDSGDALQRSVQPLPAVLDEAQITLRSASNEVVELQKSTAALTELELSLQPAAKEVSATMIHVDSIATQSDQELKKLLAPQPWYKRVGNDLVLAGKAVAVFY